MTGVPLIEGPQLSIPRRLTGFAGQGHPDLQTDEDIKQRQSHNLPYDRNHYLSLLHQGYAIEH